MVVVVVVVGTVVMGMIMMVMIVPVAVMVMVMPGLAGADALHVVVVALLCQADLRLEAEHLRAVLAELAVHQVLAVEYLLHPLGEGVEHRQIDSASCREREGKYV